MCNKEIYGGSILGSSIGKIDGVSAVGTKCGLVHGELAGREMLFYDVIFPSRESLAHQIRTQLSLEMTAALQSGCEGRRHTQHSGEHGIEKATKRNQNAGQSEESETKLAWEHG